MEQLQTESNVKQEPQMGCGILWVKKRETVDRVIVMLWYGEDGSQAPEIYACAYYFGPIPSRS